MSVFNLFETKSSFVRRHPLLHHNASSGGGATEHHWRVYPEISVSVESEITKTEIDVNFVLQNFTFSYEVIAVAQIVHY